MHISYSILLFLFLPFPTHATTFHVGPSQTYPMPSAVANLVQDGDTVLIDAGVYTGDVAVWTKNNLLLRGTGGMAHLKANGASAQGKAIWVIQGSNTTVEYIEFSGCTVPDDNGAGIRQEGAGLTIRNCYFHDNQQGILAGNNPNSDILIEYSHFARNSAGDGQTHNIYINKVRTFTLQYSYVHDASVGHNVKSRAEVNHIYYNRIMDEDEGSSSYVLDLPNGGRCFLVGNIIQQGEFSANSTIVSFGAEGLSNEKQSLFVVHNTLVNDRTSPNSRFFRIYETPDSVWLVNNLYCGLGLWLEYAGFSIVENNLLVDTSELVNAPAFNYRLDAGATAIDAGADPVDVGNLTLLPFYHYVHPANREIRSIKGSAWDVGAYEYSEPNAVFAPHIPDIKVFPNPSDGLFHIEFPDGSSQTVDLRGRAPGVHYVPVRILESWLTVPLVLIR